MSHESRTPHYGSLTSLRYHLWLSVLPQCWLWLFALAGPRVLPLFPFVAGLCLALVHFLSIGFLFDVAPSVALRCF